VGGIKRGNKKPKRAGASRSATGAARAGTAPTPVKTGSGPTPGEIGRALVEALNARTPDRELWARWWNKNAQSIEGEHVAQMWTGLKAIQAKSDWWNSTHIIHGASAEGPYVGATGFAVKFRMDAEDTTTGERSIMEEIGVYTVQKGKIIREEFMYGSRQPVAGGRARDQDESMDGLPGSDVARPMV
jgi:hypothetical protein